MTASRSTHSGRRAATLCICRPIKTFDQSFGAVARARLNQLEPASYTRLGAGIRGAGEVLKNEAGTPNRLLLVLSDGFPYDDGYEGRYAEADASKALEELRMDGVACLCLSIGAATATDALERVFGSASYRQRTDAGRLEPAYGRVVHVRARRTRRADAAARMTPQRAGSPSTRWAMMLRWISDVPPEMVPA